MSNPAPSKVIVVDGFGETLIEAENRGWVDPCYEPWTPENADATELEAIEFLENLGFELHDKDDG